jgi:uncharacterized DUF497 family protein
VKIAFDPAKSARNEEEERDLPFNLVAEFDWDSALLAEDTRFEYPERRDFMWCVSRRLRAGFV